MIHQVFEAIGCIVFGLIGSYLVFAALGWDDR